jgi:hypothetical protein
VQETKSKYSNKSGIWSSLLYFTGPVLILLVLNVVLFSLTAMQLWRLKREAARAFKSSSIRVVAPAGNRQHKDRFTLYIKLFLLMGVTWIMEVISWAIGGPDSIWYITDTVNCLRGVLIFWFCVWCNKNVRKVFLDAFSCFWCKPPTQTVNMSKDFFQGRLPWSTDNSALSQI